MGEGMKLLFAVDLAARTEVAALFSSESLGDEGSATLLLVPAPRGVVVVIVVVGSPLSFENVSAAVVVPDVVPDVISGVVVVGVSSPLSFESVPAADVVPDVISGVVVVRVVWLSTADLESFNVVEVSSNTVDVVGVVVTEGVVVASSEEVVEGVDVAGGVDVVLVVDGLRLEVGVGVDVVVMGGAGADGVVVGVDVVLGDVVLEVVLSSASKNTPSSSEAPKLRRVVVRT